MPRALIIGSGVAGPAVAQFLKRVGWDCQIFEAQDEPNSYAGLFLNVATNGLAVLESLGLRDRLLTDGHRAPRMVMWSGKGKELGFVPNGPARQPQRGSVIVRRGWLHQVLREGVVAAGIPVGFGAKLVSIQENATGVHATFANGRVETGDILLGCDGIGSRTRYYIDPKAPMAKYSGLVGLGGFARVDGLQPTPKTQHFVFGARSFFGYLVRDDGTVYWFANMTMPEPERGSSRGSPSETWLRQLKSVHSDDPYPVPQILEHTTSELSGYPIYDLAHVPHWSTGRVAAVGDAVHATSPSAGQGASLALEDAIMLARCLRDEPSHTAAFAEYQHSRQPRVEKIVKYAQAIDAQKRVTKSRLGITIRDAIMPVFLRQVASDTRNDWLYNYTVDWDQQLAQ
jgi:2-polyprenyl-6-methoxyphenol hydroxylase-like FAD-dependent oxidoreductase